MRRLFYFILILEISAVHAASADPSATIFGIGQSNCDIWNSSRSPDYPFKNDPQMLQQWVLGYLSGEMSTLSTLGDKTVTSTADPTVVFRWIDGFCTASPTVPLYQAVDEFLTESKTTKISPPTNP